MEMPQKKWKRVLFFGGVRSRSTCGRTPKVPGRPHRHVRVLAAAPDAQRGLYVVERRFAGAVPLLVSYFVRCSNDDRSGIAGLVEAPDYTAWFAFRRGPFASRTPRVCYMRPGRKRLFGKGEDAGDQFDHREPAVVEVSPRSGRWAAPKVTINITWKKAATAARAGARSAARRRHDVGAPERGHGVVVGPGAQRCGHSSTKTRAAAASPPTARKAAAATHISTSHFWARSYAPAERGPPRAASNPTASASCSEGNSGD